VLIAFDGAGCGGGPVTGVGRAFLNALAAYAARGDAECVLLLPEPSAAAVPAGVRVVPAPRGALRRQALLPRLLRTLRADVLHSSVAAVPLRARCATIATAHDLPWLHPELGERVGAWRRLATRCALRAASAVIAPSAATAADVAHLGVARAPARVIAHGTPLGTAPDAASTRARAGPFLALGDDRPRKNRDRLRAAHALARARDPALPELRLVGPPGDWVDEGTKLALLRSCRALVHVATFEGFGLPVLEGLAHGAPVVCSRLPSLVEIAGPHARFVDPLDVGAIADALLEVHRDEALRWRLADGGHRRAAELSPAATAAAWARLHREVAR
jgi:glycosyltransferase involved in cell wall biosynthesis